MTEYPDIQAQPTVNPSEDRDQFLAIRKPYFGTSAAACLFGEHPFLTAADYWLEKVAGTQQEETSQMRRGNHLEHGIAMWFAQEMDWTVEKNMNMFVRGHLAATPDYWTNDLNDLVEIKTTAKFVTEPERYWLWQVQGQMLCTNTERVHVVWVDSSMDIKHVTVEADSEMQRRLWNASSEFMDGVQNEVMADWIEVEARHVIAMYPDPVDNLETGDDGINLVKDYWYAKSQAKHYDKEANEMRDFIFAMAGNHAAITNNGKEIATLMPRKLAAQFDKRKFKQDHPDLFDEYMSEPMTTRVLNIPKAIKTEIENSY
jgi:putative phage-type endonuclease